MGLQSKMRMRPEQADKMKRRAKTEVNNAKKKLQKQMNSKSFWRNVAQLAVIIAVYVSCSISLTFYQKDLLQRLPFPITIVICHLVLKFILASICRSVYTQYTGKARVMLGWGDYLSRVAAVGVFSALDIGMSQWSLEYVTVSLYTMTKTTAILFILFFSLLLKLQEKHWSLIFIVSMISSGLFMFTYKSTSFNAIGFTLALSASFLSGIRWTTAQLIMQKSKLGLSNPLDMIFHIQPLMIITLLPFAIGFEGMKITTSDKTFRYDSDFSSTLQSFFLMLIGGIIAYVMEIAEFLLVTCSSSLTLSVVGVCKEVMILILAVYRNGDEMTFINVIGMIVCLSGILLHVLRKAMDPEGDNPGAGRRGPVIRRADGTDSTRLPLLSTSESSDEDDELYSHELRRSVSSPSFRPMDDDFFLRENRTWTSVRDSHLRLAGLNEEERTLEERKSPEPEKVDVLLSEIQLLSD